MMKKLLTAATLAALALSGTASAGTSFTNQLQTTEINQSGLLDKFDPTLGVLTAVFLSWSGSGESSFVVSNNGAQAESARVSTVMDLVFSSNDSAISAILSTLTLSLRANGGADIDLAPGGSASFGKVTDSKTATFTAGTGDVVLAAFTGPGTFSLECASRSGLSVIGGGGIVISSQQTLAACAASVEYGFVQRPPTNVPEPGTLALIGLATASIAGLSRRSRKA